jgi:putative nucleotidyltransferase with HDIG domain
MHAIQEMISLPSDVAVRRPAAYSQKAWKHFQGLDDMLEKTIGLRDPFLLAHSLSVANFAVKLAQRLGLPQDQVELIRRGSLLHDIGKLRLPQAILAKSELLTPREYEMVKTHPVLGAALLQDCTDSHLLIPMVRHHHERFDGQGYPDRISGTQIEIEARIVSLADAIDVMRTNRPYRRALSMPQIVSEINRCASRQFDPLIVEPAILILKDMEAGA